MSRIHYRARNGKTQLPHTGFLFYLHVSSFHELQAFARLFKILLFSTIWDTYSPMSQKLTKLNKRDLHKSEFSPKREPSLFSSRNANIILFTVVRNNARKKSYRTHHDEFGYGTHETFSMYVKSYVICLKNNVLKFV